MILKNEIGQTAVLQEQQHRSRIFFEGTIFTFTLPSSAFQWLILHGFMGDFSLKQRELIGRLTPWQFDYRWKRIKVPCRRGVQVT